MTKFERILAKFDYQYPASLIATEPSNPRDNAKLLIYDRETKTIAEDIYKNITKYLPTNSVLVLNQTKVIPARFEITKPSGGKAKLLYLRHDDKSIFCLSDKKLVIGSEISANNKIKFEVKEKLGSEYKLSPKFPIHKFISILQKIGNTPLPPYIKNSKLTNNKLYNQYNTVFAKNLGSVAAPTASLHFTKALLKKIEQSGIAIKYITLHVGLGTFASLNEDQIKNKALHFEHYEIEQQTAKYLNEVKKSGKKIVAVGTTVVRTLESAAKSKDILNTLSGETNLFIDENYEPKFVDCLITNFHVPKSSLMMLVSAFTKRSILLSLYKYAINKKYRLFSFGDGMLIK